MRRKPQEGAKQLAQYLTFAGLDRKTMPKDELYYAYMEMVRIGLAGLQQIEKHNQERLDACNKELIDLDHILEFEDLSEEEKVRLVDKREVIRKKRRSPQSIKKVSQLLQDRHIDVRSLLEKVETISPILYKEVTPSEKLYTFKSVRGADLYEYITGKRLDDDTLVTPATYEDSQKEAGEETVALAEPVSKEADVKDIRTLADKETNGEAVFKPLREIQDLTGYLNGLQKERKGGY
ncbi:hypothetical protein [Bacillus thuringiensis]|uniref:hypothetical protein n=1 Tax=Bacillus thuringiensis TaxID=1428 RepID=UPI000BFBF2F2|nr:hypothetical protein [Bacillus thuringiensis]PGT89936.1 hypothetical protein COD17_09305 [Bacillus thuringiensis]